MTIEEIDEQLLITIRELKEEKSSLLQAITNLESKLKLRLDKECILKHT